jgi:molybdopterin converting factor small subunit
VDAAPATLKDALEALWAVCPGLRDRVATEQGELREHVNVFIGSENAKYLGGMTAPLPRDSEISIFHAVSGGA